MFRFLAVILIYCFSPLAVCEQDTLSYFYEPLLDQDASNKMERIAIHARNAEFDAAMALSDELLSHAEGLKETSPVTFGQLLVNHGILHSASEDYMTGLSLMQEGLAYMEKESNPFSQDIINVMMATGLTQMAIGDNTKAEDAFRRAQHITHRTDGVYSPDQISIVNYITATHLKRGDSPAADREQLFGLRVSEQAYGAESVELIPILNRLGGYFAARGSTLPVAIPAEARMQRDFLFKTAIDAYERAIAIIEQNFGDKDLRLLQPLRGLAAARQLQVTSRRHAEAALERALTIVETHPDTDDADRARAHIDLGDMHTIIGDGKGKDYYLKAWAILQENDSARIIASNFFSTPSRLYPREDVVLYLDRKPDAAADDVALFAELEFSVTADGRVNQIVVMDKNVPNEQVRLLRSRLRDARFRPRIVDGTLAPTDGLIFRQSYDVISGAAPITVNEAVDDGVDDGVSSGGGSSADEEADSDISDDEFSELIR